MNSEKCPYCKAPLDIQGDGDYCNQPDIVWQVECQECGNNLGVKVEWYPSYTIKKVPCFNGLHHEYKRRYPMKGRVFMFGNLFRQQCMHCDHEEMGPYFDFDDSADLALFNQFEPQNN